MAIIELFGIIKDAFLQKLKKVRILVRVEVENRIPESNDYQNVRPLALGRASIFKL